MMIRMNNPLELLKAIKNPKEYVMNMAKQNNNPILNNLIDMANKNDKKGLENFANNMLKEQGMDLNQIMSNLK